MWKAAGEGQGKASQKGTVEGSEKGSGRPVEGQWKAVEGSGMQWKAVEGSGRQWKAVKRAVKSSEKGSERQ